MKTLQQANMTIFPDVYGYITGLYEKAENVYSLQIHINGIFVETKETFSKEALMSDFGLTEIEIKKLS